MNLRDVGLETSVNDTVQTNKNEHLNKYKVILFRVTIFMV
jgi:hypothetical protein